MPPPESDIDVVIDGILMLEAGNGTSYARGLELAIRQALPNTTILRHFGGNAKVFLRDVARIFPEYHHPITCGISGRSDSGREIPINNVGRWLFGTPGYMGHIRVFNWEGNLAQVEVPEKSPKIVFDLIQKIKEVVESGQVPRRIMSRWDEFFRRAGL